LAADRPLALVAARLVDVAPDGSASRVSYGLLNLAHRAGHRWPEPLVPGEEVEVTIALNHTAWALPAGHRLRLALSTAYWPIAWPPPESVTLAVAAGEVGLPVRPPRAADEGLPELAPAVGAGAGLPPDPERDPARFGTVRDDATGEVTHRWETGFAADGTPEIEEISAIALEVGHGLRETVRVRDGDPLSAEAQVDHHLVLRRGSWEVALTTRSRLTATAADFRLESELAAREGDEVAAERRWDQRVPRRLV
jgi:hypothetical protein